MSSPKRRLPEFSTRLSTVLAEVETAREIMRLVDSIPQEMKRFVTQLDEYLRHEVPNLEMWGRSSSLEFDEESASVTYAPTTWRSGRTTHLVLGVGVYNPFNIGGWHPWVSLRTPNPKIYSALKTGLRACVPSTWIAKEQLRIEQQEDLDEAAIYFRHLPFESYANGEFKQASFVNAIVREVRDIVRRKPQIDRVVSTAVRGLK